MIRFICELFRRTEYPPERAISAAAIIDNEGRKVSKISTITHPTTGYWIDWGGTYDTPETNILALYFNGFLTLVTSIAQMILLGKSLYRGTNLVYFVTEKYPWQYPANQTELLESEGYISAVHDPDNPSDDTIDGRRYPVKMEIPSIKIKLPDSVSGSALQLDTFSIQLINNDGFFDLSESNNFFNVPLYILKSFIENPDYSDFDIIRRGFVDDMSISLTQFSITAATIFRSLSEDVHKTITITDYPNAPSDNIGKKIPIVWGTYDGIEVIEVDTDTYIIIDPDYIATIDAVYDSDGNVINPANYSLVDGLLVMTSGTPATADVTGNANNGIGEIITEEMESKSLVLYAPEIWDTTETDAYIASGPNVNLFFEGGSVRELIAQVLKSDNAFLIEKSNGLLSLRKWGGSYANHNIESWTITKKPDKKFVNSKFFVTKARVIYSGGIYVDDSQEDDIAEIYRKKQTRKYETNLATLAEAQTFAADIIARHGQRAEIWNPALGINTKDISILDKVKLDIIVNERKLSNKNSFIVKEIDISQDILTLEAIGTITIKQGILSGPAAGDYLGYMSGLFNPNSDAIMPQLLNREDS